MHDDQTKGDETSDARLLAQIAAGTESAFIALYRRHHGHVHRFAFALARSASIAQDVTQEVFLNALQNAARFDAAKGTVKAWLLGCARHRLLDRLRAEARYTGGVPEESVACEGEEQVLTQQRLVQLHAAIARLPLEYREALVLCELEELTYAESAAVLECPIGTVRSRLHRARALLCAMLNPTVAASAAAEPAAPAVLNPSEVCS